MLTEKEKQELLALAKSPQLNHDMRYLSANRHNPFVKDEKIDIDRLMEFMTTCNEFINHRKRPFKPIADTVMKL